MRWSGSRKDWPQFKLDWKQWERMGESTGVIPNEVKFNCFRNAVDKGTKEALAAALEADPAMTFQQWWDRLDATYGGDSLQTAWAEWVNHHLVVEGATLTLPAWRVFEGKFYKLRNRVPTITEVEATRKVIDNLPSRRGETDWLQRVTGRKTSAN